uniref:uncharacterized protein LOC120328764 isoform X3 n=1 Tax=Styela clava TaxID=7725 RepID=UPI001939DE5E|nr:uncharacterized protein LOC120328764 isoform X3 [Styela clava]
MNGIPDKEYEIDDGLYTIDDGITRLSPPTPTPRSSYQQEPPPYKSTNKRRLIIEIIMAVIIIVLLIVLLVMMNAGSETEKMPPPTPKIRSCMHLRDNGKTASGFYYIKPDDDFKPIETYCDMSTDGGGWTLVASVHEKDIMGKCDIDDRWTTFSSGEYVETAWANKKVFGNVMNCTDDDYKNSAYFSSKAKDVMIWHVPPEPSNKTMEMRATLRYRTTNHFLHTTGGNLKSLFGDMYPLQFDAVYPEKLSQSGDDTDRVLDVLIDHATHMKNKIPDWFSYNNLYHSAQSASMRGGGNSLYMYYGNQVSVYVDSPFQSLVVTYGKKFTIGDSTGNSAETEPFIFALAFKNKDGRKNLRINYWNSVKPTELRKLFRSQYNTRVQFSGKPANVVIGYLLLTRKKGKKIEKSHLDDLSTYILDIFMPLEDLFGPRKAVQDGLLAPITFDKGSDTDIMNMIPPNFKKYVEPGYLQFRAYADNGYPNAMCPGVRMKVNSPQHICIGGLANSLNKFGTCSDFTGWAGKSGDTIDNDDATGHAHSQDDISSSILIFYR